MLTNGIYDYVITATKEGLAQTKYGDISTVDIDVMIDGQQRGNIRLWLNDANTNRAKVGAFLQSLGMIGTDGKSTLRDWSELIGKHGRATWEQKRLNRGGIVYNGRDFLPYEGPAPTPTPTVTPKEENPAPVKAETKTQAPELEPLTAEEQAAAAAVMEALLQDPEVQEVLQPKQEKPIQDLQSDSVESLLVSYLMLHCQALGQTVSQAIIQTMANEITEYIDGALTHRWSDDL